MIRFVSNDIGFGSDRNGNISLRFEKSHHKKLSPPGLGLVVFSYSFHGIIMNKARKVTACISTLEIY